MCLRPLQISDKGPVACRDCEMCRANRVNDLVGRCISESKTASATHVVSCTYADSTRPNSTLLNYHDFQLWLKTLRNEGYKPRFLCVGEYGSKKGRAHWHAALFWYPNDRLDGQLHPSFELDKECVNQGHWPHGFLYVEGCEYQSFWYILKYVLKGQDPNATTKSRMSMSRRPLLGYYHILSMAQEYVDNGLPLRSPQYTFRESVMKNGERRKYWLSGRSREVFVEHYRLQWAKQRKTPIPYSEFMDKELAKLDDDVLWALEQEAIDVERRASILEYRRNPSLEHLVGGVNMLTPEYTPFMVGRTTSKKYYAFGYDKKGSILWLVHVPAPALRDAFRGHLPLASHPFE